MGSSVNSLFNVIFHRKLSRTKCREMKKLCLDDILSDTTFFKIKYFKKFCDKWGHILRYYGIKSSVNF